MVNTSLMGWTAKMEEHFRELKEKLPISGKRMRKLLSEIEKNIK